MSLKYSIFLPMGVGGELADFKDPVEAYEQARTLIPEGSQLGFPGDILSYGLIGSPETIRQRLAAYEAAGVQELVIGFFDVLHRLDAVHRFAREFIL